MSDEESTSYEVFLSHRYRATAVNLHLYGLFSEGAGVQFKVDALDPSRLVRAPMTSVTRLERMIRDATAFVGFFLSVLS